MEHLTKHIIHMLVSTDTIRTDINVIIESNGQKKR